MCHYILVMLPHDADRAAVGAVFAAHKLGFKLVDNPHLLAQFPAGECCVSTATLMCDCGTALGWRQRGDDEDPVSMVTKLRKQGWGEAKIQRWLGDKLAASSKRSHKRNADAIAGIEQWRAALTESLRHTKRIGVMLHWFRDALTDEQIAVTRQAALVDADTLADLREDIVYEFSDGRGRR